MYQSWSIESFGLNVISTGNVNVRNNPNVNVTVHSDSRMASFKDEMGITLKQIYNIRQKKNGS